MKLGQYEFWFITGSQFLYGDETLAQVEENSKAIVAGLNSGKKLPCSLVFKGVMKTHDEISRIIKEANQNDSCAGIIAFCHTFSPGKMWIGGFSLLQKPYMHFHTQFYEEIPNEEIDMDYMNLHQSAHGDREHGFIGARMGLQRKVVVGYWAEDEPQLKIAKWMRAAVGAAVSKATKVMRFGDNMREVAVTEGDKVEAQIKMGWQVNTMPVGRLVECIEDVTSDETDSKITEYKDRYIIKTDDIEAVRYQAREEIAIKRLLDEEGCIAFSNTFQDLYGMKQLPGLATQNLMALGYGYGGEGDWKISAMTAVMKAMSRGRSGGTSFMEDYTYDLKNGLSLGAHMLEVCPSIAAGKPQIKVYPLGIGDREPPARLVFEGKAGPAVIVTVVDMGGRLRLILQEVECVTPTQTMPNLPVARVMWKAAPDFNTAAHAWILAGGAHHTVLSYDCDTEMMRDWARIMDIEFVLIDNKTNTDEFEKELMISDLVWRMK